ncbi:hypothetical protein ACLB2K_016401 [Fragaria x ananassa]
MIAMTIDSLNVQYGNLSAQLRDLKAQNKEIVLLLQQKIDKTCSMVDSFNTKVDVADLSKQVTYDRVVWLTN